MKFSFFKALAAAIFGDVKAKNSRAELGAVHRKLKRNRELQAMAREHGNRKRIDAWQRCVSQAYAAKRQLVEAGKGHNTLAGIPA